MAAQRLTVATNKTTLDSMIAVTAWLGLGSNLDDPEQQIAAAHRVIATLPSSRLIACSSRYRSAAWGATTPQPDYVNAVVAIETTLPAQTLLRALHRIERAQGRVRAGERYAARTLDIDLLLYGDQQFATPELTVPHPRLHERAFVLLPLAELAPDLMVPERGRIGELLAALPPSTVAAVHKLASPEATICSDNL